MNDKLSNKIAAVFPFQGHPRERYPTEKQYHNITTEQMNTFQTRQQMNTLKTWVLDHSFEHPCKQERVRASEVLRY